MSPPPIAAYSPLGGFLADPAAALRHEIEAMRNAHRPRRLTAAERLAQRRQFRAEHAERERRRVLYRLLHLRVWRHPVTLGTLGGLILFALLVAVFP